MNDTITLLLSEFPLAVDIFLDLEMERYNEVMLRQFCDFCSG